MSEAPSIIPEYSRHTAPVSRFRGALIQTGAIFVDAYRELNHRKMFWIVLILSGIVVIGFAGVAIDANGLYVFGMSLPIGFNTNIMPRGDFYKMMFNTLGVGMWLSWIASILALISTAGIFPDLLTGGSVDLYLSKPLSRWRLFLTKYIAALLFVTIQVGIFTVACFLVMGIRGHVWLWGLFLTVPVMVCFFSYLFCMCVLLGVLTRSTLAALLLTLLCWFGIWIIHTTESTLLFFEKNSQQQVASYDREIAVLEKKVQRLQAAASTQPSTAPTTAATKAELAAEKDQPFFIRWAHEIGRQEEKLKLPSVALAEAQHDLEKYRKKKANHTNPFVFWHNMAISIKTVMPKTTETIELLNRGLAKYADIENTSDSSDDSPPPQVRNNNRRHVSSDDSDDFEVSARAQHDVVQEIHHRSIGWVIGTSLCFEAVMLLLAGWLFARRDF